MSAMKQFENVTVLFIAGFGPIVRDAAVEKSPVAGDIWLASHFSMRSSAKVMLLFPHKGEEDDTYFNYHRAPDTSAGK